ncbi:PepSY domain-containing protein [Nocardia sp. NPDC019395]|uniref:PepSY domain-containing protein n=1 Tax=Nocardia sp. NPDC019395 TaxID=3154686 RepID=UPI0033C1EE7D
MGTILRNAVAGLRWLLVGAAVAAVVAGACLAVAAVSVGPDAVERSVAGGSSAGEWMLVSAPGIDRQRAMDTATAAVPGGGRAISAELDTEHRTTVWEVEVVTPAGAEYEVSVDANTGDVLGTAEHD